MAKLRKLKLAGGDLVDKGANQHADIVFFKADIAKGPGADAVTAAEAERQAMRELSGFMDQLWQGQDTLRTAVEGIVRDPQHQGQAGGRHRGSGDGAGPAQG